MKKILVLAFIITMAFSLTACTNNENTELSNSGTLDISQQQPEQIDWSAIGEDGLDEELFVENLDVEMLETIAYELQGLVEEIEEEGQADPGIFLTGNWWVRAFDSERYNKVLDMGQDAMKPLYLIIYKSPNDGLYELSDFDFEWSTSKEFLTQFNEKIVLEG